MAKMETNERDIIAQKIIETFAIKLKTSKEYEAYKHATYEELGMLLAIKFAYIFKAFKNELLKNTTQYNYSLHNFVLMDEGFGVQLPRIGMKFYKFSVGSLLDVYLLSVDWEIGTIIKYLKESFGIEDQVDFLEAILLADIEIDYNDSIFENVIWLDELDHKPYIKSIIKNFPSRENSVDFDKLN